MFKRRHRVMVIDEGLNIVGNVSAEGLVEVHGEIVGELKCTALHVSEKGRIIGLIVSQDIVVNGTVEGPIHGVDVRFESKARVTGDVHHKTFTIESGAFFDGRSKQNNMPTKEKLVKASAKQYAASRLQNGSRSKSGSGSQSSLHDHFRIRESSLLALSDKSLPLSTGEGRSTVLNCKLTSTVGK